MASVLNARSLFIDSVSSNHMVVCKDYFTSLDSDSCISIHMEDDSQVSSKGKGIIHLEHGSLKNVLYIPSLASNLLYVYQMKHTGFTKRVVFISNDVDIFEITMEIFIAVGKENHATKTRVLQFCALFKAKFPLDAWK